MIPDENKQEIIAQDIEQDGVIPVAYKQETKKQAIKQKN